MCVVAGSPGASTDITLGVEFMGRIYAQGGSLGVLIPKELRDKMGFRKGEYMAFVVVGDRLVMRRVLKSDVLDRDTHHVATRPEMAVR